MASFDTARAKRIFELYDTDGSGMVDVDEIGAVLRVLGLDGDEKVENRLITKMIANADTSGTGELTFEDFCKAIREAEPGEQHPERPDSPNSSGSSLRPGRQIVEKGKSNSPFILRESIRKNMRHRRKSLAKRFGESPSEQINELELMKQRRAKYSEGEYFELMKQRHAEGTLDLTDLLTSRALDSLDSILAKNEDGDEKVEKEETAFESEVLLPVEPQISPKTRCPPVTKRGTFSISLMGALSSEKANDPTLQQIAPSPGSRRRTTAVQRLSSAPEETLAQVMKLLEGRFHNALMILSKRIEKLIEACRTNGNVASQAEGMALLRDATKELGAIAGMVQNTLKLVDPLERSFVEYPEPDTVEESISALKFLCTKLVGSFHKLLPKIKRWRKNMMMILRSSEYNQITKSLEKFDPQITQVVLTIDTATRFLEDDQSFKKATALLLLGIQWKSAVASRRAAKQQAAFALDPHKTGLAAAGGPVAKDH
jgi:hypothetical protein